MRRRKFYLSQWQGAWNMVTQSSCNSKPTHAHFNYYDVCSCSALIALLVWAKDLNCQDHICSIFFLSSLELGNLQEGQWSFERAVCFLDSASPRGVAKPGWSVWVDPQKAAEWKWVEVGMDWPCFVLGSYGIQSQSTRVFLERTGLV